jgi:hypothetical protein
MTDEQLQSLFAGMERHIDRRADAIEHRVAVIEQRLDALELKVEKVETTLLSEFHKWASPAEARSRTISAALRAIDLEMEALSDRVSKLEGGQKAQ